ncbi:protein kinase kin1 [Ecytonucleospora hepatopenaei]|uniref:Protein kinase kin1 n=1 Tax=Ecytonucleospora hepatopenaei TaxID=646526 RepID=A0A1W0E913_9MICR|nr:protein kinase kin1 [Ecytonucleospora hepatopenaei]
MLVGRVPFDDESIHQLQNKIKSCKFVFHKGISKEAQELLTSMILASDARINLENVKKAYWTNFGYKELLNNFMLPRKTIASLNSNIVNILEIVSFIHFENAKQEMEKYIKIINKEGNNLEKAYWSRKPIVSLYYLMMEKFSEKDYTSKAIVFEKQRNFKINEDTYPVILHNYVNFLSAKENNNIHNRFFSRHIFKKNQISHLKNEMVQEEEKCDRSSSTASFDRCQNSSSNEKNFPEIRKSFVKGFFKGLKIKNTTQEDIKTKLLKVFLENNISYEASEKSYYCSYIHDQQECYFKLTLYFNVILSEHYVVLNCLNKNSNSFKAVYEILKQKISE